MPIGGLNSVLIPEGWALETAPAEEHSKDGRSGRESLSLPDPVPGSAGGHVLSMTSSNRETVQKIQGTDQNAVKEAQETDQPQTTGKSSCLFGELWTGCYSDRWRRGAEMDKHSSLTSSFTKVGDISHSWPFSLSFSNRWGNRHSKVTSWKLHKQVVSSAEALSRLY